MDCQVIVCNVKPTRGIFCAAHFAMLPAKHRQRLRQRPPWPQRTPALAIKWLTFR